MSCFFRHIQFIDYVNSDLLILLECCQEKKSAYYDIFASILILVHILFIKCFNQISDRHGDSPIQMYIAKDLWSWVILALKRTAYGMHKLSCWTSRCGIGLSGPRMASYWKRKCGSWRTDRVVSGILRKVRKDTGSSCLNLVMRRLKCPNWDLRTSHNHGLSHHCLRLALLLRRLIFTAAASLS